MIQSEFKISLSVESYDKKIVQQACATKMIETAEAEDRSVSISRFRNTKNAMIVVEITEAED